MFESKKKSLKEKLSDTATQVNKKTGDDFEKVSGELQSDIQQLAVNFNEKLQELESHLFQESTDIEEEEGQKYLNHYECDQPGCGEVWDDEWSCMCDDRCPKCNTPMSPIRSEEI